MATNAMTTINSVPMAGGQPGVTMSTVKQETEGLVAPSASISNAASKPGQASASSKSHRQMTASAIPTSGDKLLDKRRLQQLVQEVDPLEQLDDDVEEVLMQIADDFIDNVASAACNLARHRKSNVVDVKDVHLHLERNWNMHIPGFGSEEVRPYRKAATTEAHKQRLALIKKTLKKY